MPDEPLRTTTFTLTTADALAYENAVRRVRVWGGLVFFVWLAAGGAAILLVPAAWRGTPQQVAFWLLAGILVVIQYTIAMLWLSFRAWRRARRRIRRPMEVTLQQWPDRFGITGHGIPRYVTDSELTSLRRTRTHLFVQLADELLIVPRRAFAEEGAFDALAVRFAAASARPPSVDPELATP